MSDDLANLVRHLFGKSGAAATADPAPAAPMEDTMQDFVRDLFADHPDD